MYTSYRRGSATVVHKIFSIYGKRNENNNVEALSF